MRIRHVLLLFALAPSLLGGCSRSAPAVETGGKAARPEPLQRVEVQPAVRHTFHGQIPITGELRPVREVTLKSRVAGNVVELPFDEGDTVKKGQLVARIEDRNQQAGLRGAHAAVLLAEAQLERARADLERLQRDQARIETLYARGAADKKTLDDIHSSVRLGQVAIQTAQAQLLQARANDDGARIAVSETQYRAPFDGVISRRGVSLHEYIDTFKNRDLVTIVDTSAMELVATVPADLAGEVVVGTRVEFQVGAISGKTLPGEVIAVNPTADPRTRTVRLRVRIPNEKGLLKGGMYATGALLVGGERASVGVPAHAVYPPGEEGEGEGPVVWRVKNGTVERVPVRTGVSDGELVEVLSGLREGEQVVVSSPAGLKPGARVQALPAQALQATPGTPQGT